MSNKINTINVPETIKFGEHLVIDAYGCDYDKLGSADICYDFLIKCAELADMRILTLPYTVKADSNEVLGGHDPGGVSAFMMIYESHISIHTFAKRGFVTFDVYSCKEFDEKGIVAYFKDYFKPADIDIVKTSRGMKYPKENIY